MTISREDMRDLKGAKIKIDGNIHVVHKAVMRSGVITTEDGIEVNAENAEKKGKFWCFPAPKKARNKKATDEPAETPRQRRAREKKEAEDNDNEETPRQRRAREKREAAEAEAKPSRRARNRNKDTDDDEPSSRKRVPRGEKKANATKGTGATRPEGKKKKLVEAFDQAIAEHVGQEVFDMVSKHYALDGKYALMPVAVGGDYSTDGVKVVLTMLPNTLSEKQIKAYIRDHREATDISPDDEEDDDLEDLEDDDNEDDDLEDAEDDDTFRAALGELDVKELKKIARALNLTTKKSMDDEAVIDLLLEESDEEAIRAAAADSDIELSDAEEEEEDSEEEEEDDDDSDEDEDEDDDSDEDEDDALTVDDMVAAIAEAAPDLKAKSIKKFVEAYLENKEVEGAFGDDLAPGFSKLQEKGGEGPEFLLVGYDEEKEQIKLLNLDTLKTRSKDLLDVVHMDVVDEDEDEE